MTVVKAIIFGEVLFDHFPGGVRVLGGAPFNVAWHLQAFGAAPLFISRVGDDAEGREIREVMSAWGMDLSGLQSDGTHSTGAVKVSFTNHEPTDDIVENEPTYDIVEKSAYDFIDAQSFPTLPRDGIIYHGSLALREPASRNALGELRRHTRAPAFVDINLRPPWWNQKRIERILQDACWLKLNAEELHAIVPGEGDGKAKVDHLLQKYPLRYVVVTRGREGAQAITRSREAFHASPGDAVKVTDTVGAGDAFSSVLLLGLLKDWPLRETMERAQVFAGAVVGIRGAVTRDRNFYRPFIESWKLD